MSWHSIILRVGFSGSSAPGWVVRGRLLWRPEYSDTAWYLLLVAFNDEILNWLLVTEAAACGLTNCWERKQGQVQCGQDFRHGQGFGHAVSRQQNLAFGLEMLPCYWERSHRWCVWDLAKQTRYSLLHLHAQLALWKQTLEEGMHFLFGVSFWKVASSGCGMFTCPLRSTVVLEFFPLNKKVISVSSSCRRKVLTSVCVHEQNVECYLQPGGKSWNVFVLFMSKYKVEQIRTLRIVIRSIQGWGCLASGFKKVWTALLYKRELVGF